MALMTLTYAQAAALALQAGLAVPAELETAGPVVLDISPGEAEMMVDNANDRADDSVTD